MKRLLSLLCLTSVLSAGCATTEQTDYLENQVNWMKANIRDRDRHIQGLDRQLQEQQLEQAWQANESRRQNAEIKNLKQRVEWDTALLYIMIFVNGTSHADTDEIK